MSGEETLTQKQQHMLELIIQLRREHGLPPTVRELANAAGLKVGSVQQFLKQLESKGYIRRGQRKSRGIEIMRTLNPLDRAVEGVPVPLVGRVAAGQPLLAVENVEAVVPLSREWVGEQNVFMLRVKGDSMIEDAIQDGDYVVARQQDTADNGDIVVAMIDDEATVKRFYRERKQIRLQPANSSMKPIITSHARILGKVIWVLRKLG
jgi:repressor LexA